MIVYVVEVGTINWISQDEYELVCQTLFRNIVLPKFHIPSHLDMRQKFTQPPRSDVALVQILRRMLSYYNFFTFIHRGAQSVMDKWKLGQISFVKCSIVPHIQIEQDLCAFVIYRPDYLRVLTESIEYICRSRCFAARNDKGRHHNCTGTIRARTVPRKVDFCNNRSDMRSTAWYKPTRTYVSVYPLVHSSLRCLGSLSIWMQPFSL